MKRVLIVAAHQDDETLSAGAYAAIKSLQGYGVDFLVATDGSSSYARRMLRAEAVIPGRPAQRHALTPREFVASRDAEFLAATDALRAGGPGVSLIPPDRARDGRLRPKDVEDAIEWAFGRMEGNPYEEIIAPSPHDDHRDHAALGSTLRRMYPPSRLRFAVSPKQAYTYTYDARESEAKARVLAAIDEYRYVNPAEGRFGIAALSVGGLLSSLAERPVSLIVP